MTKSKKKINWLFYLAFVIATVSVTKLFTSHKYFTAGDTGMGAMVVALSSLIFLASLFVLAFEIYSEEKAKDNLRVSFAPFDYLYKRFKQG